MRRGAIRRAAPRALALALALGTAVSGCTFKGVSSMPLPGGVDTGSQPYDVKMVFENVLDLVPQSQCRVNDVPVGMVTKIDLVDWKAVVTCRLRRTVDLPANAVATISQTSLLGEKFVALSAPQGQTPQGRLAAGAEIPLDRTSRSTEVEEVLSAMSMLVTGGGLEQISTINHELNAALQGHTTQLRDVLNQLNTFVGTLDRQKNQIVTTIDKVDQLAATLAKHNKTIADTIDSTGPAVKILASQRKDLTKLLVNMDRLGTVATRVINRSQGDTVANLKALQTILTNTNKAGETIPKILGGLFTFPFPQTVSQALKGDYGNLMVSMDLNVADLAHNLLAGTPLAGISKAADKLQNILPPPRTGLPDTPLGVLPGLTTNGAGQNSGSATPGSSKSPGTPGSNGGSGGIGDILPPLGMSGPPGDDLGALLQGGTA
ncbi:MCE family protein [Actinoallomurus sp. NBC_01490]|uniref:MCE family protein n=1 Tax=Actinoallomurus sp. NBC_01490 TaxID=2903557 RepID=UPI002E2F79B4|nr:MCE family protein [Actinoallomurus sp. NBC_01490]